MAAGGRSRYVGLPSFREGLGKVGGTSPCPVADYRAGLPLLADGTAGPFQGSDDTAGPSLLADGKAGPFQRSDDTAGPFLPAD